MKRIVVTPAGRERYLEVLFIHMKREFEKGAFDEWHMWLNTNVESDINYCKRLESNNQWVKTISITGINVISNMNIHKFFKFACEPNTVYVRVDDDIVFIEPGFFDKIFSYRVANPQPFLVYGNIINNAVIAHIHQRNRRFDYPLQVGYLCMDDVGWKDPRCAEAIHRAFLKDVKDGNMSLWHQSFKEWNCDRYERVSINCISWLGSTFAEFQGVVGNDEEQWLSVDKAKSLGKPNMIIGNAIVVHFAFFTQRDHLDASGLLDEYMKLATTMYADSKK